VELGCVSAVRNGGVQRRRRRAERREDAKRRSGVPAPRTQPPEASEAPAREAVKN